MECIEPERVQELQSALDELASLMEKHLDAQVLAKTIITSDNREVVLRP